MEGQMNTLKIIIPAIALLFINACSSSSSTSGGGAGAGGGGGGVATTVDVITVSGATVPLTNVYSTGCYVTGASTSSFETLTVTFGLWAYSKANYSDTNCLTNTSEGTVAGALVAGNVSAMTGWVNGGGGGPATAPTAADSSGPLSDTESFTALTLTVTDSTGDFAASILVGNVINLYYIVDDTGTKTVLYRDDDYNNGVLTTSISDPFIQL